MPSDPAPGPVWQPSSDNRRSSAGREPLWRREAASGRSLARRLQLGLATALLLGLTTMLIWASTWLRPLEPSAVVLIGAGYEQNLAVPPSVCGWRSLQDFADLAQQSRSLSFWGGPMLQLAHQPVDLQKTTRWEKALDGLEQTNVVVFMSLHGASDPEGAYLLPADATVQPTATNRLRLKAVIQRLGRLPEETNKLLILDAVHFPAHWPLGMLQNDFARRLKRLEPFIRKVPNLVVLCASDEEQLSWTSPTSGRTVFAHYLIEGLRGAAADRARDGRLDAWDVHQYVRGQVRSWVLANRGARQVPLLLPGGDEGRRRAKQIELLPVQRGYRRPDPNGRPTFSPPAELVEAWKAHRKLAAQTPEPWVYTPHLWQRYQCSLIRYEQLLEADQRNAATTIRHQIDQLRRQIEQGRRLNLATAQHGLAMLAAAGVVAAVQDDDEDGENPVAQRAIQVLDNLWTAKPPQRAKLWKKTQEDVADAATGQLLRLHLYDLLLRRAADDPAENLRPCYDILQLLDDPLHPWPAEIHSLVMLQRDLASPKPDEKLSDLIQLSLRVRRLAEQTALATSGGRHPYSEQVYRWIGAQVDQADELRRRGEDLLFGGAANWPDARDLLKRAQDSYERTHRLARKIGRALNVRNRLFSELPHYTHWLASCESCPAMHDRTCRPSLDEIQTLWDSLHRLDAQLGGPGFAHDARPMNARALRVRAARVESLADDLEQALDDVRQTAFQSWKSLTDVDSPGAWLAAAHALQVPLADPRLRMKLLAVKHRTAQRLLSESRRGAPREGSFDVSPGRSDPQVAHAQHAARIQGRLAMAVLGTPWFDEACGTNGESFAQVRHRLDVFSVEDRWWQSLAVAGEQIGRRWQRMPEDIGQRVDRAAKADFAKRCELLRSADRLTRVLEGAAELEPAGRPARLFRRALLQGLLVWQAERTLDDHWFAEEPSEEPYYRVLGLAYLDDADTLGPSPDGVKRLREALNQPGTLEFSSVDPLELTTQPEFSVTAALKPSDGARVPAGLPALWIESGPSLALLEPAESARQVRRLDAQGHSDSICYRLESPRLTQSETHMPARPKVESTEVTLCGLYRGQPLRLKVPVRLHLAADRLQSRFPPPEKADLAVRASPELHRRFGEGNGAVAIVLDCTGSMGPAKGKPFDHKNKYAEALDALEQVLGKLPQGTRLSLWVFGQAEGSKKTVKEPEHTIRRILAPTRWNPADADQLSDLMGKVRYPALEPWNESPIVHAIVAAKADLQDVPGYKTILVLTDGIDNRFAHDPQLNPKSESIPKFLTSTLAHSGIEVNIIGFRMNDDDQAKAWKQFEVVSHLFPPGKFVPVSESGTLVGALEAGLKQHLRYWVRRYDNRPLQQMPAQGLDVSGGKTNDQWLPGGLDPGFYKVRLQAGRRVEKAVALERGDLLLLRLVGTPHGAALRRTLYAEEDFPWKPFVECDDWRLSLLQNQRVDQKELAMLLALEKKPDLSETVLQQIRPERAWIEVDPRDGTAAPLVVRWHAQPGYPAPTWSLGVPDWPTLPGTNAARKPRLRVWWNPEQPTAAEAFLKRGHDFNSLEELTDRELGAGDTAIRVAFVGIEKHVVQVASGVRKPQNCLVVRIEHDPGATHWVRLAGLHAAGCEHRFYTEIGHYTGLFWPVALDEARRDLDGLELVRLERFKQEAKRRGYFAGMDKLSAPEPSDDRPRPPLGDKTAQP